MNELEDMVCYNNNGKNNLSELFGGKYKLETQNASNDECDIEPLLKYDGIVLPVGLYYLQNFKTPKLNYKVEEEPVQDDLIKMLMDLNNGGNNSKKVTKSKKHTRKKHLKK